MLSRDLSIPVKKSDYSVNDPAIFTLSVSSVVVECTRRQSNGNMQNIQVLVGRLGWKWIRTSILLHFTLGSWRSQTPSHRR